IGQTHQANEAWQEAINSYRRILDEYPGCSAVPDVNMLIAECQINLSKWREARMLYDEFLTKYPKHGQVGIAQARLTVLKNLERFQTLLSDEGVDRNKDDAQFQIGRIVLVQLNNPVKAVAEFRKVVEKYPKSDVADDAQLEVGKALLSLNKLEEARSALLDVPRRFPNSPAADDALFLVGKSYEQNALRLASVTAATARDEAYERNQKYAYQLFNTQVAEQNRINTIRRDQLKAAGKSQELGLDEASNAFRFGNGQFDNITITSNRAGLLAETESALQVANRQDRVNEAYREAVRMYVKAAADYPLGNRTDESLLRVAQIFETYLKDRAAAMRTYQKIVKLFPGTPVAEDAAWKVALFHEQERKYAAAAAAYREFIRNYPGSKRVADAQFSLAEVFEHLGQWVDAMDAYEIFRQKFQQHPKSRLAVDQINWIKTYRRK
ncbi:MAG: tetratricopeptide repeat protein, partial [Planctomycetes bacterium]|nr:tetratricopeptide repeat protein [Planctomycetota bacterium]